MQLSTNYTLRELTSSDTASRDDIDNTPGADAIPSLRLLCLNVLQPVRDRFGPVTIKSGFRSLELDCAIKLNAMNRRRALHDLPPITLEDWVAERARLPRTWSHHTATSRVAAADLEVYSEDNLTVAHWMRDNLDYDQLISEYYVEGKPGSGWIHVSNKVEGNRNQERRKIRGVKGYPLGLPTR